MNQIQGLQLSKTKDEFGNEFWIMSSSRYCKAAITNVEELSRDSWSSTVQATHVWGYHLRVPPIYYVTMSQCTRMYPHKNQFWRRSITTLYTIAVVKLLHRRQYALPRNRLQRIWVISLQRCCLNFSVKICEIGSLIRWFIYRPGFPLDASFSLGMTTSLR